jgi:hypothetical protein
MRGMLHLIVMWYGIKDSTHVRFSIIYSFISPSTDSVAAIKSSTDETRRIDLTSVTTQKDGIERNLC